MKTISLEQALQDHFGYPSFRYGQKEIISDVLRGKDVLGILPTGTGKSICYQLPTRLLDGVTLVVSPLISLMMDQVRELKAMVFKEVVAINSFLDYEQKRRIYQTLHHYKLIFVSPEILQQKEIQFHLKKLAISLFVVDEAHCISQWGHEFRPDYQKLHKVIQLLGDPPILALSATATKEVQKDIIQSLQRPAMIKHIYPMDRPNIMLSVQEVADNKEKLAIIKQTLAKYKAPTLIYFSSKAQAEQVAYVLAQGLPNHRIAYYHGGMEQMDRINIQQQFMNDQLDVICCTSAFGMGINKNNVRIVFHYHFPGQMESFIQEIGRAGRDGEKSLSIVLYCKRDKVLPQQLIQSELPSDEDLRRVFYLLQNKSVVEKLLSAGNQDKESVLEISETQWNFISAQLEKHSTSLENVLQYDQNKMARLIHLLQKVRDERMAIKQSKFYEMMNWLQSSSCLRKKLYAGFQDGYTVVTNNCCSNCGIHLDDFHPNHTLTGQPRANWEKKLKWLLVGEKNEAK